MGDTVVPTPGDRRGDKSGESFPQRVYALVRGVPRGRVVTYGQVAALVGRPGGARQVGYALAALPDDSDVPWQRVINARGEVSPRAAGAEPWEGYQRFLLEEEGVEFDNRGRLSLELYRWLPRARRQRRGREEAENAG